MKPSIFSPALSISILPYTTNPSEVQSQPQISLSFASPRHLPLLSLACLTVRRDTHLHTTCTLVLANLRLSLIHTMNASTFVQFFKAVFPSFSSWQIMTHLSGCGLHIASSAKMLVTSQSGQSLFPTYSRSTLYLLLLQHLTF